MLCRLYKEKRVFGSIPELDPCQFVLRNTESVKNGVIVRDSSFVSSSVADDFNGILVTDFDIANLLTVGAFDSLKSVIMSSTDYASMSDSIDKLSAYESKV